MHRVALSRAKNHLHLLAIRLQLRKRRQGLLQKCRRGLELWRSAVQAAHQARSLQNRTIRFPSRMIPLQM